MPLSIILILYCSRIVWLSVCRKSLQLNMLLCVAPRRPSKARSSQVDRGEGVVV